MHSMRNPLAAAAAALALAACGQQPAPESEQPTQAPTEQPAGSAQGAQALDPVFESAAAEFGVPADLLKAVSFAETRWQHVEGHQEFEGMPAAYGLMALRGERLERGAQLAGVRVQPADPLRVHQVQRA